MARLVTVIADDLTGAADSAVPFAQAGLPTLVFLDGERDGGDCAVAAVDTNSRAADVTLAVGRTRAAAEAAFRAGCPVLYQKVDSTLRGHVGSEVAAAFAVAIESSRDRVRPIVLMATAFPATGRVVRSGRVMVDGTPLPISPAALLGAAGLVVTSVASAAELGGGDSLRSAIERMAATAVDAIVCDGSNEDDLRAVAEAGARLSRPVVWVGSGGLARHLPRALGLGADMRTPSAELAFPASASGPTLVLVGSRTQMARHQAAALAGDENVETIAVGPATLLAGDGDRAWGDAVARLDRALRAGRDAAVVISPEAAMAEGAEQRAATALGRLAAVRAPIGALVATGGDTARGALRARGVDRYQLLGALEAGVPFGMTIGVEAQPALRIVTKAGAFGTEDTLVRCCASLRKAATRSLAT
jgi:uncharacterized protein YgbK (DUF1537 family)